MDSELLGAVSYLLQHGAKPEALDLVRLSTNVPFPRLKVGWTVRHWFSLPRICLQWHKCVGGDENQPFALIIFVSA